ncbi:MAG: response regulator transcription factor [Armatimonadetes bacterium]|nr:response regulator transcription factor [Armatimonadota bacterium]
MEKSDPLRILIADDHRLICTAMRSLLPTRSDLTLEIVGQAHEDGHVLMMVQQLCPDVVLMEMGIPQMGALELTQLLKTRHPVLRVLIYSLHCEALSPAVFMEARADGYLPKDSMEDDLFAALRLVFHGGIYYGPPAREPAPALRPAPSADEIDPSVEAAFELLTPREQEVLPLLAKGLSYRPIAGLRFPRLSPFSPRNSVTSASSSACNHP